jgi:hypothetical protein
MFWFKNKKNQAHEVTPFLIFKKFLSENCKNDTKYINSIDFVKFTLILNKKKGCFQNENNLINCDLFELSYALFHNFR